MTTPQQTHVGTAMRVPLDALQFGHAEGSNVNARSYGREEGIAELAASILTHGQIQPLLVRPQQDGTYTVVAGNRRLAAFQHLAAAGQLDDPHVDVTVRELADSDALEISLAENVARLPLHPVDQFEVFARLGTGQNAISEKAIAERFGIGRKEVRQRLALGRLAPEILAAWQAGAIHAETAETFTLARDQDHQREVFVRLKAAGQLHRHYVQTEFSQNVERADGRLAKFVGLKDYKAAGGQVRVDLFSDRQDLMSPVILHRLVAKKTEAMGEELKAEGWSWVALKDDLSDNYYTWERLKPADVRFTDEERAEFAAIDVRRKAQDCPWREGNELGARARAIETAAEARSFSAEEKARAGAVIVIDFHGEVSITRGVVQPGAKADKSKGAGNAVPGLKPIGAPLAQALSEQYSTAIADSLARAPDLALAVMLASFLTTSGSPCCVRHSGRSAGPIRERADELRFGRFPDALAAIVAMSEPGRLQLLAAIAGAAIDASLSARGSMSAHAKGVDAASIDAVVARLDPETVREQLADRFDASAYFAGATKAHAIAALTEMFGRNTCISPKKGDIAALAAIGPVKEGWLPAELRTVHYDGPGAKKPKAKRSPRRSALAEPVLQAAE